jgi:hypothetical protein
MTLLRYARKDSGVKAWGKTRVGGVSPHPGPLPKGEGERHFVTRLERDTRRKTCEAAGAAGLHPQQPRDKE